MDIFLSLFYFLYYIGKYIFCGLKIFNNNNKTEKLKFITAKRIRYTNDTLDTTREFERFTDISRHGHLNFFPYNFMKHLYHRPLSGYVPVRRKSTVCHVANFLPTILTILTLRRGDKNFCRFRAIATGGNETRYIRWVS